MEHAGDKDRTEPAYVRTIDLQEEYLPRYDPSYRWCETGYYVRRCMQFWRSTGTTASSDEDFRCSKCAGSIDRIRPCSNPDEHKLQLPKAFSSPSSPEHSNCCFDGDVKYPAQGAWCWSFYPKINFVERFTRHPIVRKCFRDQNFSRTQLIGTTRSSVSQVNEQFHANPKCRQAHRLQTGTSTISASIPAVPKGSSEIPVSRFNRWTGRFWAMQNLEIMPILTSKLQEPLIILVLILSTRQLCVYDVSSERLRNYSSIEESVDALWLFWTAFSCVITNFWLFSTRELRGDTFQRPIVAIGCCFGLIYDLSNGLTAMAWVFQRLPMWSAASLLCSRGSHIIFRWLSVKFES